MYTRHVKRLVQHTEKCCEVMPHNMMQGVTRSCNAALIAPAVSGFIQASVTISLLGAAPLSCSQHTRTASPPGKKHSLPSPRTCLGTSVHACKCACERTHLGTCAHMQMSADTLTYVRIHMYMSMHACTRTYLCACICSSQHMTPAAYLHGAEAFRRCRAGADQFAKVKGLIQDRAARSACRHAVFRSASGRAGVERPGRGPAESSDAFESDRLRRLQSGASPVLSAFRKIRLPSTRCGPWCRCC